MPEIVAAVVAFVLSTAWYVAFGGRRQALLGPGPAAAETRPPAWKAGVELARNLLLAVAVAWLAGRLDLGGVGGALVLAGVLWLAFPVTLLVGSVMWDRAPAALAAIHAGDWLLKLVAIALVIAWLS